jgi:hypothetical protein
MPQAGSSVKAAGGARLDGVREGVKVEKRGRQTMKRIALLALFGLAMFLPAAAGSAAAEGGRGHDLETYEKHKAAELEIWRRMETMALRQALLVEEEPSSFGVYAPRGDNRYRPGDPVHIYAEPVGHTIREADGIYVISLALDFTLLDESGKILGGQRDFDRLEMESRRPVMEFMVSFTYDTEGLPAGNYTFETLIRDSFSDRRLKVQMPIVIAEQAGSPSPDLSSPGGRGDTRAR